MAYAIRTAVLTLAVLGAALFSPGAADALSFQADFRSSTYQTGALDSYSSLLLQHQAGSLIRSNTTTGLANISTSVYANGVNSNYSLFMRTSFQAAVAGTYTFQVGTDWGRGGAAAVIDGATGSIRSEQVIRDDVWWGGSWSNPDVFTTSATLAVGEQVTFAWVGFEGCCGGSSTIRFSINGSGYQDFTQTNFQPYTVVPVPEPSPALLLSLGLIGLRLSGRR